MKEFCNNEEWLAAYLDRRLTDEERRAYEKHVADCPRCLATLFNAKGELDEMTGTFLPDPALQCTARREPLAQQDRSGITEAARQSPPRAPFLARVWHATVTYSALATSIAMIFVLSLLMLSPAWDPELRAARTEIDTVLSAAQIGELRLAGGRDRPGGTPVAIRGNPAGDYRRFERLEGTLKQLIRRYPRNPEVHQLLGHLHFAMNRFDRAEVAYRRAALLAPDDGRSYNDLAVVSYRLGRTDLALIRLIDAAQREHVPPEAYYNLGIIYHATGKTAEANRYLESYIHRDPTSPWAEKARALIKE